MFDDLKLLGLTALFNPAFLILILLIYFIGKYLGKLTVRMNIWKFLLLAYFAIFLIDPLRQAGLLIGLVFFAGFFSNHIRRLPSIIGWADNLSDIYFAYKYRSAYEDIRRQEDEIAAQRRRAYEQAYRDQAQQTDTQNRWRKERQDQQKQESQHKKQADSASSRAGSSGQQGSSSAGSQSHQQQRQQYRQQTSSGQSRKTSKRSRQDECLIILGLEPGKTYSAAELKSAYRKRVKKVHPDVGGSDAAYIELKKAYDWLML